MTTQEEITLDELKSIVLKFEKEKKPSDEKIKIIENNYGLIQRERTGKINPKFCVKWHQMDKENKINRLIEYSKRYTYNNQFPQTTQKKLNKLLVSNLMSDQLMIDYDTTNGRINQIINLKYDDQIGFQIGSYDDTPKMDFISKVSKISSSINQDDNLSIITEDYKKEPKSQSETEEDTKSEMKNKTKTEIKQEPKPESNKKEEQCLKSKDEKTKPKTLKPKITKASKPKVTKSQTPTKDSKPLLRLSLK